jgi:glycosyltransferase involved in cell wall biosynthesis
MTTRHIVFWEPSLSPHKGDLFNALTGMTGADIEVTVCADTGLLPERAALGWAEPAALRHRQIVTPDAAMIERLTGLDVASTLHVVSGMRHVPTIVSALAAIRRRGARLALMSEPRVGEGFVGALRYLQSWLTEGWLRRQAEFVLAIGRNGPPWFRSVGYPDQRIFPYAYFVAAGSTPAPTGQPDGIVRIAYVGRLVPGKGIDDLLAAVAGLGPDHRLLIVGDGPERQRLTALGQRLGVAAEFTGVAAMARIAPTLAECDVLVLASTSKDGWGVTVSEALLAGTAAVATPLVGASLVLDDPRLGRVVPPRSPAAIATAIRQLHRDGAFQADRRQLRRQLAAALLTPEAGARLLLDIIRWCDGEGARPDAALQATASDA